jgi:GMP synthase-like glutamine amidotransferase
MIVVVDNRVDVDAQTPKSSLTTKLIAALPGESLLVTEHRERAMPRSWTTVTLVVLSGSGLCLSQTTEHPVLAYAREMLGRANANGVPCLGICFGMQVMAHALGASVFRRRGAPCYRERCAWVDAPVYFNHHDGVAFDGGLGGGVVEIHPDGHVIAFGLGTWTGVQWHPEGTVEGRKWLRRVTSKKNVCRIAIKNYVTVL